MDRMKQFGYRLNSSLARLFYGRNGFDNMARASYILGLILIVLNVCTGFGWLYYLYVLLIGYSIFRAFSRNIQKRYAENQKFMEVTKVPRSFFKMCYMQIRDIKYSRYYMCGKCHQQIRVPRGKGRIEITCPRCRNKFVKRT
jgi:hypothetical protein